MTMQRPGELRLSGGTRRLTVEIDGQIGLPDWWSADDETSRAATYENFRQQLDRLGQSHARRIDVHLRSTGGNINDALLIYETLCALAAEGAEITTRCYGYTASAATIVAQAASPGRRLVSSNALYLIHNATTTLEGNSLDAEHTVRLLGETDARLAEIYATRSGRPVEQFRELMARNGGRGEWLSASDAVAAGLADRVSRVSPLAAVRDRMTETVRGWFRDPERPVSTSGGDSLPKPTASPDEPLPAPLTDEGLRSRIRASTTRPHEDPMVLPTQALGLDFSQSSSPNDRAYESDALRLRTGF